LLYLDKKESKKGIPHNNFTLLSKNKLREN